VTYPLIKYQPITNHKMETEINFVKYGTIQ
jgi:hypothetical protein